MSGFDAGMALADAQRAAAARRPEACIVGGLW